MGNAHHVGDPSAAPGLKDPPPPKRFYMEMPKPFDYEHGNPTDRDWVQPLMEAMMAGARAWLNGAELVTTPVIHLEKVEPLLATLDKQRQLVADALFVLFGHWVKPEMLGCCPWTPEDWRTQADSLLSRIGVPTDSGEAS